jgi:glycosyltransferase involved in cell wall biosynthesis
MKTPVIIAAHNEATYIGQTLESLHPGHVEPIVVDNGSTDNTAEVAARYGAVVLSRTERGKLPAQQYALKALGERALEPVIFLDADTSPVLARQWAPSLIRPLMRDTPAVTAGLIGYKDGPIIDDTLRFARRLQASVQARSAETVDALYGSNMAIALRTPAMLDRVLDMPHIWPGEDRAMAQMVKDEGGDFYQSLDLRTVVRTSSRYCLPIIKRLMQSRSAALQSSLAHYKRQTAEGAVYSYHAGAYTPLSSE